VRQVPQPLSPEQRVLRSKIASGIRWANTSDPTAATAAARAAGPGSLSYFERQLDPDGTMDPAERSRRAEHLKKAHYARLVLKSAKARAKKAGGMTRTQGEGRPLNAPSEGSSPEVA